MKIKLNIIVNALLIVIELLCVNACSSVDKAYHKHIMKGSILEVQGSKVYLCIGTHDGTQEGQKQKVYRNNRVQEKVVEAEVVYDYVKEYTGNLKITEIVNEHYAKATIISGTADINSIVELE